VALRAFNSETDDFIEVYVKVDLSESGVDEEGICGFYLVLVDASLEVTERAKAALDSFHEHIGIEELYNYNIFAINHLGEIMDEGEGGNDGNLAMAGRGEFFGSCKRPTFGLAASPGSSPSS
jgi:hypothetical protein